MAALVFTEHLRRAGLSDRVRVTSAGTGSWHIGQPADARAMRVLSEHGYSTEHMAAQVSPEHLDADLLLCADAEHARRMRGRVEHPQRVRLLRSFDPAAPAGAEVPDPYYGDGDGFTEVLGMIEATMPGLLSWVRERL